MCTVTQWDQYDELGNDYVKDCAISNLSRPIKDEFLEPLLSQENIFEPNA